MSYFPLTIATLPANGLQDFGIYQELIDRMTELSTVCGLSAYTNPFPSSADGYSIHSASALAGLQVRARALVDTGIWVVHTNSGGDWSGETSIPIWTWNNNATTVILNSAHANVGDGANFTRRYGDADNLSTSYGYVALDDITGIYTEDGVGKIAEFLNEIYRVLNLLQWTTKGGSSPQADRYSISHQTGAFSSAQEAYDDLVANWPGSFSGSIGTDIQHYMEIWNNAGDYRATGVNVKNKVSVQTIPTSFPHAGDLYVTNKSSNTIEEFDDDGLGYSEGLSLLSKVYSFTEATTSSREIVLGDDTTVQDKIVTDPPDGSTYCRGYQFNGTRPLVLKWVFTQF